MRNPVIKVLNDSLLSTYYAMGIALNMECSVMKDARYYSYGLYILVAKDSKQVNK